MRRLFSIALLVFLSVYRHVAIAENATAENAENTDSLNNIALQNSTADNFDQAEDDIPASATPDTANKTDDENEIIPGQYIVYYKQNADRKFMKQRLSAPFRIIRELRKATAVAGINDQQYQELLADPSVEKVVPDYTITIESARNLFQTSQIACGNFGGPPACRFAAEARNPTASWGLDRIDQPSLPLDAVYSSRCDGTRVQVYVLDTGIRKSHVEFGGRASCGANFIVDEDCQDYDGHGTHVAGTVGGSTYGVAKGVDLVDVKVFNREGRGSLSAVLAGIDHVVTQKNKSPTKPMVMNMSLGSVGTSTEIKDAVDEAVAAGIVVVVAAGNRGMDACNYSPAYVPNAITVAASDTQDMRPIFSNFGSCVDIHAPGVQIISAFFSNDRATAVLSGTSMAAPHVAGAAALYLQANPNWTPAQVWRAIRNDATSAIQGTARPLLQTQFIQ